ncbi:HlyD family secretion protein [Arundinibacter roseus]|uniref:HlyD family efflux transporter periplasmic adaptor subunit n=1 Tax=Arundinibacter roseus TaxID=2070510 RepID=A0A4R4JWI3_9BACT|nr:HlyD family efflux transporter periplasmic adaptor subunit [Arundinibacter roseus]TDB57959.1 HlyD family efflux transporter periplasmic adaptor subunit [Arundinibacter roseus]
MTQFKELHSDEVHEIISRPPPGLVRWGMTLFLGMVLLLALGSWLIHYPDVITTSCTLTATDAPRTVVVRTDGKLARLLITDGQTVQAGQALAYSESTADPEQVLHLRESLDRLRVAADRSEWGIIQQFSILPYHQLGEIQTDFQSFHQQLVQLKSYLSGGFYLQKRSLLQKDQEDLQGMEQTLSEQLDLQRRDYDLAQSEFTIHEKLYRDKVIAPLDYQREKVKLLGREMPLKQLASALIQNRTSQTAKQKELLELDNAIIEQKGSFMQSLQTLRSSLEAWEHRYILRAPVAGKVSFSSPWQEQQSLNTGQELLTIEPKSSSFQGLIKLPQANLGKLRAGQSVLIKLDGYPYREYGMVEGVLAQLSLTPGADSTYWGYVHLPKGLRTRYDRELLYRNGMKGTAEIITNDRRLAERLVDVVNTGGR